MHDKRYRCGVVDPLPEPLDGEFVPAGDPFMGVFIALSFGTVGMWEGGGMPFQAAVEKSGTASPFHFFLGRVISTFITDDIATSRD